MKDLLKDNKNTKDQLDHPPNKMEGKLIEKHFLKCTLYSLITVILLYVMFLIWSLYFEIPEKCISSGTSVYIAVIAFTGVIISIYMTYYLHREAAKGSEVLQTKQIVLEGLKNKQNKIEALINEIDALNNDIYSHQGGIDGDFYRLSQKKIIIQRCRNMAFSMHDKYKIKNGVSFINGLSLISMSAMLTVERHANKIRHLDRKKMMEYRLDLLFDFEVIVGIIIRKWIRVFMSISDDIESDILCDVGGDVLFEIRVIKYSKNQEEMYVDKIKEELQSDYKEMSSDCNVDALGKRLNDILKLLSTFHL